MPIYEYQCNECQRMMSFLVLKSSERAALKCKSCGSEDLKRLLSRFAYHKSEGDRLSELDTSNPRGDEFYKDSRNVGLWAKKRAQELGADLGPEFDEVVDRARTGKILEDYDL
ncbi:MAG: zinc ribbon domain-containing protein [Pseudomonadota bacterium]